MRVVLDITPAACGAAAWQGALAACRDGLGRHGAVFPDSPGARNHVRLLMAASDPDRPDALRWQRGYGAPDRQARLARDLAADLARDCAGAGAAILSCDGLASALVTPDDVARLAALLAPLGQVEVAMRVGDPARVLASHYAAQVMLGRTADLRAELDLAARDADRDAAGTTWATGAVAMADHDPARNRFAEVQAPPPWLDPVWLLDLWEGAFGAGSMQLAAVSPPSPAALAALYGLPETAFADLPPPQPDPAPPSAAHLERVRRVNPFLEAALGTGRTIPRPLRRKLAAILTRPGPPIDPGMLTAVASCIAPRIAQATARFPALAALPASPDPRPFAPADPGPGFQPSQWMAVLLPRIDAEGTPAGPERDPPSAAPPSAAHATLPAAAREILARLGATRYAPRTGPDDPGGDPFPAAPGPRTGTTIVACMKNEGPYILEWISHHRAIGVDRFLIYTNGCEDGTDAILQRLDAMGVVEHRANDDWRGKSPQQFALNRAMDEPAVQDATWVLHIDVDEFVNVRTGDGTLAALLAALPPGTSAVALTWRLFGHAGITAFDDAPVMAQFTRAAPRHCPKPHIAWGFKTLLRTDGTYGKLSCHRPQKPDPAVRDRIVWVNGSGQPMPGTFRDRGWRSDLATIGYDLVQLNHYALRSAESFLIKRQRGRALHVDRTIGLNYWIRMDWSHETDRSALRHLPRMEAERARLMADARLADLHLRAAEWHRTRAAALRATPEFAELYAQATALRLTPLERAAWALALDMES